MVERAHSEQVQSVLLGPKMSCVIFEVGSYTFVRARELVASRLDALERLPEVHAQLSRTQLIVCRQRGWRVRRGSGERA